MVYLSGIGSENMGAIGEIWRGGSASVMWFFGLPVMSARVVLRAKNANEARRIVQKHFQRFIDRCRVSVELDGPAPQAGGGCVISHNEASFMDIAGYCAVMWPHIDRVAAADIYKHFPFGQSAMRRASFEMVPRGNRAATAQLMTAMVARVRAGDRLVWGGEGRIAGIDGVARFKIGGSLIAIRAQVPLVPVMIYGGHQAMPLGSVRARPGTIYIRFADPIPTVGMIEDDARDLADRAQAVVAGMYAAFKQDKKGN